MTEFKRRQENEIDPEKIWDDDAFHTLERYANFLTNALIADNGNFVLNVNGAWGTGKTFFVNRWAEQLRQAGHPVVEFNAWENDSAEDPLAPLIASLIDSQKEIMPPTVGDKLKQGCGKYILAGGGLIVRAGLKQLLGEKGIDSVNDMLSDDSENELIELAGQHVEEQLEKKKAAKGIADQLKAFVAEVEAHQAIQLPVFIFIDELDRCRPTFAIELLERVKHLFHVDGIKFVISTDSTQLVHSIQGVYGANFDSSTYLQRFFDETFNIPRLEPQEFAKLLFGGLDGQGIGLSSGHWLFYKTPAHTFSILSLMFELSLRDQVKVHHRVVAVIKNITATEVNTLHFIHLCSLVMLRLKYPRDYEQILRSSSKSEAWNSFVKANQLNGELLTLVHEYFCIMDMDRRNVELKLQRSGPDREATFRGDGEIEMLKNTIYVNCYNTHVVFKEYPQLVELTSQLS